MGSNHNLAEYRGSRVAEPCNQSIIWPRQINHIFVKQHRARLPYLDATTSCNQTVEKQTILRYLSSSHLKFSVISDYVGGNTVEQFASTWDQTTVSLNSVHQLHCPFNQSIIWLINQSYLSTIFRPLVPRRAAIKPSKSRLSCNICHHRIWNSRSISDYVGGNVEQSLLLSLGSNHHTHAEYAFISCIALSIKSIICINLNQYLSTDISTWWTPSCNQTVSHFFVVWLTCEYLSSSHLKFSVISDYVGGNVEQFASTWDRTTVSLNSVHQLHCPFNQSIIW